MKEATDAENPKVTRNVGPKSRKTAHRNHNSENQQNCEDKSDMINTTEIFHGFRPIGESRVNHSEGVHQMSGADLSGQD